jgi:tetratricopeptide (TPR) repeat protein
MVFLKKQFWVCIALFSLMVFNASAQDPIVQAFADSYTAEKNKDYKKAIASLTKVYAADGYEINLRLGWLNYISGQLAVSVQYYQKAIALKPYAIEPKLGLTYPLGMQNKVDELIALYNRVLETDPQNTTANYRLGYIYYNKGQYEKAGTYLEKVINLYPFDYDSLLLLAWNNLRLQKVKEARVLFQKVLMYNPGDASATEGLRLLNG